MALKPIKVSQLNKYIGRVLQTDPILGNVSVLGEISNLKYHGSGHVFFTLKDEGSRISCFMPASSVQKLRYELTDGMEVIVFGYISVYEKSGYYSLNVRDVQISGEGNLSAAYKALFKKLEKEGLFDDKHKKMLPVFPKKVCVITSETGAAVRDILKIIRSRNDIVNVLVYPCLVQGPKAAGDIASAIAVVNEKFPDMEVIITGRGGGSLEELWAFNEEVVARAIYASEIPVISAVGHETDFSISDYVADLRAETPTAAAAMAVPDTYQLRRQCVDYSEMLKRRLRALMDAKERSLKMLEPERFTAFLKNRMQGEEQRLGFSENQLKANMRQRLAECGNNLEKCIIKLEALNPQRIVNRGYAIVYDGDTGTAVTSAAALAAGRSVRLQMKDGDVLGTVDKVTIGKTE